MENKLDRMPNLNKMQQEVLEFWKENKTFEKSLIKDQNKEIVFYDGPPFPTGKPHHGTVLVSFIKDMVSRYHTMQGYSVPRQWGRPPPKQYVPNWGTFHARRQCVPQFQPHPQPQPPLRRRHLHGIQCPWGSAGRWRECTPRQS